MMEFASWRVAVPRAKNWKNVREVARGAAASYDRAAAERLMAADATRNAATSRVAQSQGSGGRDFHQAAEGIPHHTPPKRRKRYRSQRRQKDRPISPDPIGSPRAFLRSGIAYLTAYQVDDIHDKLIEAYADDSDPIEPGKRDGGQLLESAITRPLTSWGGAAKYKTVHEAAAALTHSLVHNHPYIDGNKRTATVALLAFLNENKKTLLVSENEELFDKVKALAEHQLARAGSSGEFSREPDAEVATLAKWIKEMTSERFKALKWWKFKTILQRHNCTIREGTGLTVTISRSVHNASRHSKRRTGGNLVSSVNIRSDGHELDRRQVRRICKDLGLDHNGGFDIHTDQEIASFINEWRDVLDKLGELDRQRPSDNTSKR